jgi:plasmid stability protein
VGSVTIRNLDDAVKQKARLAAAANGRSLEAELRALLERTYAEEDSTHRARMRAMSGAEFVDHLIKVADGAGEGVFDELESERHNASVSGTSTRLRTEFPDGMAPLPYESFVDHITRISRPGLDLDPTDDSAPHTEPRV